MSNLVLQRKESPSSSMSLLNFLRDSFGYPSNLFLIARFIAGPAGKAHGISRLWKAKLAAKIMLEYSKINSLSPWQHHLMVEEVLKVPPEVKGDVVECGCFCGSITASLSLACAMTSRELIVCDSFEGLPKPRSDEAYDIRADFDDCEGRLEGVKSNVAKFGSIEACQFVKGDFSDSLPNLDTDSVVLVFEDGYLKSSVEDCLPYLRPKLQEGCRFYCDEPWSIAVVGLFYDEKSN